MSEIFSRPPAGTLVVIATPIGNLGDVSTRAAQTLASVDVIACEDTRRTGKLLQHLGVSGPRLLRLDQHRERAGADVIIETLAGGGRAALVSDAGTPSVSDPGERVVEDVIAAGYDVTSVPGPSAALAALVVSGLPTDRFVVEGFLPRRGAERAQRINALAAEQRTAVVFERPQRMAATLTDLAEVCDTGRRVALCRELTKLHEEVWRGTLADAIDAALDERGELVVVIEGADPEAGAADDETIAAAVARRLEAGRSKRDAVSDVATALGVPRNTVYDIALTLDS